MTVIEAMRFDGDNGRQIERWSENKVLVSPVLEPTDNNPTGSYLQIATLEGTMTAIVGDWIIKGVKGEFYPCKPDIFTATYELAVVAPSAPVTQECLTAEEIMPEVRRWLCSGGNGHEDGEDGIRAGMMSMEAAIEMAADFYEYMQAPALKSRATQEWMTRAENVLGILPCEECGHSLALHFDRNGCEYERGDHEGGEGDHGPYGAYAMGPCGCKAENLSDDGNDAFFLLRDLRQMRILASESTPTKGQK